MSAIIPRTCSKIRVPNYHLYILYTLGLTNVGFFFLHGAGRPYFITYQKTVKRNIK